MNFFGKNLKHLRKRSSQSQTDIGILVNKVQTTIGNWENSVSQPNIDELLILSNYFGIPVDSLLKTDLSATDGQMGTEAAGKHGDGGKAGRGQVGGSQAGSAGQRSSYDWDDEESMAMEKDPLSYALHEIKSMREEIKQIRTLLGDNKEGSS